MEKLLEVNNLKTYFHLDEGTVKAVDGVDFDIYKGKTLGIVGESGCGKSVTSQSVMRIVPSPPGEIMDGEILYHQGDEVIDIAKLKADSREMRALRGSEIAMIFQEPMNSFSPVHTIGSQIIEAIRLHQNLSKDEAREKAISLLDKVRIPRPAEIVDEYPHQLSGGMRQRAMIALALSCEPALLIADEPTTALDVTVQAQILELINDLQEDMGMGMMLITHDLGVVAQTADYVAVVYLGRVVEHGSIEDVFNNPLHPYTRALFASIPKLEGNAKLNPIRGSVPDPFTVIHGCPFKDRCNQYIEGECDKEVPPLIEVEPEHQARCVLYKEGGRRDG
jgi:peptide/nickel transport system ATP-binding protein